MQIAFLTLCAFGAGFIWGGVCFYLYEDRDSMRLRRQTISAARKAFAAPPLQAPPPPAPRLSVRETDRVRVRVRIPLGRPIL